MTMATETKQLAVKPLDQLKSLLDLHKGQIQSALPKHLTADRMLRIAVTAWQKNPRLQECAPITVVGAIVQAAQLGLEIDDGRGFAYMVPFMNNKKGRMEAQFIPGYRGLIDLARRSGEVKQVMAQVVYEKDIFECQFGLNPILVHRPAKEKRGNPVCFYAVAWFTKGGAQFDVMSVEDVEKIRQRSKAKDSGPWVTDYIEMGKKTVIRRLAKLIPASSEFHTAVSLDERASIEVAQDLGQLIDPDEKPTPQPEPIRAPARLSDEHPAMAPVEGNINAEEPQVEPYDEGENNTEPDEETADEAKNAPSNFRSMKSRYYGTCATCNGKIAPGSEIWYDSKKKVAHCQSHFSND